MANEEPLSVVGLRASADPAAVDDDIRWTPSRSQRAPLEPPPEDNDSLREYLSVISRHKLVVLLCALLTPLAALLYSSIQERTYEASAAVLVNPGGAGSILSDIPGIATTNDPERLAATNVSLARLPIVARRTVASIGLSESASQFLGHSRVAADTDADILRFIVADSSAHRATALATAYAQQFTRYRNGLDLEAIRATRATIVRKLAALADRGERGSPLYTELQQAVDSLDAAATVRGSAAVVVQPAQGSSQVQPRTKRNVMFGLILGLLYGIGLAFLIERLDTRARTPEQVEAIVGLPALGELPPPPELTKARRKVAMLEIPYGPYAESVRKLRANLEFASLDDDLRVLMISSPVAGDGKTTVAADLAVAFARAGRSVVLCDFDGRAPTLSRVLGLEGRRGLVDIALGHEPLERVLVPIPLGDGKSMQPPVALASTDERPTADEVIVGQPRGGPDDQGRLVFLPFGSRRPHDPGDFVNSSSVRRVVARLREAYEIVLIDTAPLLPVSDARTISEYVDAALIVCGIGTSRKPHLQKLRRIVSVLPTRVFGIAVTGVPAPPAYGTYGQYPEAFDTAPRAGRV